MDDGRQLQFVLLALFAVLVLGLADATARYFAVYYTGETYPLGTVVRPAVFLGATVLLVAFALIARRYLGADRQGLRLANASAVLGVLTGVLFVDGKVLGILGVPLPSGFSDAMWFVLFGAALVAIPLVLAVRIRSRFDWGLAIVPVLLATGFLAKLLDPLYFWLQNGGIRPPYGVVLVGMFAPTIAIPAAGFLALALDLRRNPVLVPSRPFWLLTAVPASFLVPVAAQVFGSSLPNLIMRGWTFWTLGYVGYGWVTPSLFVAAAVAYGVLLLRLRSRDPDRRLLFLALLTFPLSGVFVFFLDYSSIPGALLSVLAAAFALESLSSKGRSP